MESTLYHERPKYIKKYLPEIYCNDLQMHGRNHQLIPTLFVRFHFLRPFLIGESRGNARLRSSSPSLLSRDGEEEEEEEKPRGWREKKKEREPTRKTTIAGT